MVQSIALSAAALALFAGTVSAQSTTSTSSSSSSSSSPSSANTSTSTQPYANASAIALVQAQYNASGFDAPIGNSLSFDIPLQAQGLLQVHYNTILITNGAAYPASQVANLPTLMMLPAMGANLTESTMLTVMLADASALGNPDVQGDYRHYLANSVPIPDDYSGTGAFNLTGGNVITSYAGPGPLPGTGAHRYAWLVFLQPENFTAPANLSNSGTAPSHWNVESYVATSGLSQLVAASFFTVENGAPTAAVVSSTAVNTATLSIPAPAASGSVTSGPGAAAKSTGAAPSGAVIGAGALLVAMVGGFVMLLA